MSDNPATKLSPAANVYNKLKRVADFSAALVFVVFLSLPMLVIGVAVSLTSRGPAIFSQRRIGLHGKEFRCYKFRTMKKNAPKYAATGELEDSDRYITALGRVLRKTSLDELPQIINVLKGDMSFVGPRPLIPGETYIHSERNKRGIYNIRPGITGWAQVHGRDLVSADEKIRLDCYYLQHFGPLTDLKIIAKTFFSVLAEQNIREGKQ